jgi:fucose 4-O-acetylase-like acetyltransferase
MGTKKIIYISIAQAIGILLVILGHSYPFHVEIPKTAEYVRQFIYSFHMPLFIFVSGFLIVQANSIKKYGNRQFIKRRALKLLLPYFILSLIGIIPKFLLKNYINDAVENSPMYFLRVFLVPRENIWGHFWFIPMIFVFGVLSIYFVKLLEKSNPYFIGLLAISAMLMVYPPITGWFGLNDLKNFLFYYLLGMLIGKNSISIEKILSASWVWVFFPIAIFLFFLHNNLDISGVKVILKSIIAVLMILIVLWMSNKFLANKFNYFSAISKNIFSIYILSWPCQAVMEIIANRLMGLPFYTVMALMFSTGLLVPLLIIEGVKIIENNTRVKFLSPIIGRTNA